MTMEAVGRFAGTTTEYHAAIASADRKAAELAKAWGVEAVGRGYPTQHSRGGYNFTRPGKWYVVRNGERQPASASQSRSLHRCGHLSTYGSIGPIAAA